VWPWTASTEGEVYILHFHQPLGNPANRRAQASHYVGFAEDLEARLAAQLAGRGAKIVQAAIARGIGFDIYHWPACLAVEKLIKRRKETAVFCPTCAAARGRKPKGLPIPVLQLALDLSDIPEVTLGRMDWLELTIQAQWRSQRIPSPAGIDDDLL